MDVWGHETLPRLFPWSRVLSLASRVEVSQGLRPLVIHACDLFT